VTVVRREDEEPPSAQPTEGDVLGTRGNDRLVGTSGADALFSFGGRDHVQGGAGDDVIDGGNKEDEIDAGPGNDRIRAYDGYRDVVRCGPGHDVAYVDPLDLLSGCEERYESQDTSAPETPRPPTGNGSLSQGTTPDLPVTGKIVVHEQPWVCRGPVDADLVKVTMRTNVQDAIRLDRDCSGRIGRIEVDTWTADGVKVQNHGTVAHDLVIGSGYIKCHDVYPGYHQDGIQAMGGYRLTFKNLAVDCLGNANLFLSRGGAKASTPTDVICEHCTLGPNSAQTLFWAASVRSGARDTRICTGRYRAVRMAPLANDPIDTRNTILPRGDSACADVAAGR
jgi:hypothetical protein